MTHWLFQLGRVQESAKKWPERLSPGKARKGSLEKPASRPHRAPTSPLALTFTSPRQGPMQPPDQPGQHHDACLHTLLLPWIRLYRTVEAPCPHGSARRTPPSSKQRLGGWGWGALPSQDRWTRATDECQRDQKMMKPCLPPACDIPKHTDLGRT